MSWCLTVRTVQSWPKQRSDGSILWEIGWLYSSQLLFSAFLVLCLLLEETKRHSERYRIIEQDKMGLCWHGNRGYFIFCIYWITHVVVSSKWTTLPLKFCRWSYAAILAEPYWDSLLFSKNNQFVKLNHICDYYKISCRKSSQSHKKIGNWLLCITFILTSNYHCPLLLIWCMWVSQPWTTFK